MKRTIKTKHKKSGYKDFCKNMLSKPKNQAAEVLYELMYHYKEGRTRLEVMNATHILNVPANIMTLRGEGVAIETKMVEWVNKHKRPVRYGNYVLLDFREAELVYHKINK